MAVSEERVRKALSILMTSVSAEKTAGTVPDFSSLIKQARTDASLSLQEVADAVGCTKSYLWDTEQAKTNPSAKFVWEICKVLAIDPVTALESAALCYKSKRGFARATPKASK